MDLEEMWTVMRGMLGLAPGAGETVRPKIITAEKIVKMHRGVRSDQMAGIVSRAGAVAGDMSIDGTGTGVNDGAGAGAGVGAAAAADSAS